jgi:hypothetical protein
MLRQVDSFGFNFGQSNLTWYDGCLKVSNPDALPSTPRPITTMKNPFDSFPGNIRTLATTIGFGQSNLTWNDRI